MSIIFILIIIFVICLIIGVPVAFALGIPSIFYLVFKSQMPVEIIAHRMTGSLFAFVLLALPAFLMAGRMMNSSGITERIFDLAIAIVGRVRGGLAQANALASMIFASMSGTAIGDTGGLGQVELRMMRQAGYSDDFAAGLTACSSVIGPIIPPSVNMVILGAVAEISIGRLFLGGFFPGILMGLSIMAYVYYRSRFTKEGQSWPVIKKPLSEVWRAFKRAFFPLLMPVIIIGGIVLGVMTPTEAAIAAIDYAIILGIIYRELTLKKLWKTLKDTVEMTGVFMFIFAIAGFFSWILTIEGLPQLIVSFFKGVAHSQAVTLLILGGMLLIIGCFLDVTAAILLVTPAVLPAVKAAGIDPVHFGIVMIVALIIGIVTPPFGICLFVMSDVAKISVTRVTRACLPYLIPMTITLLLVILIPALSTWLPNYVFNVFK